MSPKSSKMNISSAGASERVRNSALKPSNPSYGWSALSLCIAKIIDVFHPEMRCNIEIVYGEHQRPKYSGVELCVASAGARHFLGAIPQKGDYCVVGWVANSNAKADRKQPVILTWMPRTPWFGQEWLPVQDYSTEEGVLNNPKDRQAIDQVGQRIRFKMRHIEPGNVLASSAQGSDLVLDEGVLLTNRRANEIRLRDQDQAIVMRSIQQFHATAGARVYSGMVQRDAQHIPKEMISDGGKWDGDFQVDVETGIPFEVPEAMEANEVAEGNLLPHKLFLRDSDGKSAFEKDGGSIEPSLNPYNFFFEANLIDKDGFVVTSNPGRLLYGGKSILRMNKKGLDRKAKTGSPISNALSEYRVEVSHTSDGTLPVTEQTDGFDSERLAEGTPLVEFVLGSVVGNDPFSAGRSDYGLPLGVSFLDGVGTLTPFLEGEVGTQCATLLKVSPLSSDLSDSFISFTKNGALKAQISDPSPESIRANVEGGGLVEFKGELNVSSPLLNLKGGVEGMNSLGVNITSPEGAVNITAGGFTSPNEGAENQDQRESQVSLNLSGRKGVSIQSGTVVKIVSPVVDFSNVKTFRFSSQDTFSIKSGSSMSTETSDMTVSVSGSKQAMYAGPSNFNPLNNQGKSETFGSSPATGSIGGAVKSETVLFGDVDKTTLTVGDRNTTVVIGNINHTSVLGSVNNQAGLNSVSVSPLGISATAVFGNVEVQSIVGQVNITGTLGVGIRSASNVAILSSSIVLKSPDASAGFVMCASDLHPLIGKPYGFLGLLPRTTILG